MDICYLAGRYESTMRFSSYLEPLSPPLSSKYCRYLRCLAELLLLPRIILAQNLSQSSQKLCGGGFFTHLLKHFKGRFTWEIDPIV